MKNIILAATLIFISMSSSAQSTGYDKAFQEANQRMHQGMTFPASSSPDYDFLRGMRAHHQGAIEMAEIELKYGKDKKAKQLASDIIKAQRKEIALMDEWIDKMEKSNTNLRKNVQPAPAEHHNMDHSKHRQ